MLYAVELDSVSEVEVALSRLRAHLHRYHFRYFWFRLVLALIFPRFPLAEALPVGCQWYRLNVLHWFLVYYLCCLNTFGVFGEYVVSKVVLRPSQAF